MNYQKKKKNGKQIVIKNNKTNKKSPKFFPFPTASLPVLSSQTISAIDFEGERERGELRETNLSSSLRLVLIFSIDSTSDFPATMNEKAGVSKELNARHRKVISQLDR